MDRVITTELLIKQLIGAVFDATDACANFEAAPRSYACVRCGVGAGEHQMAAAALTLQQRMITEGKQRELWDE